MPNPRATTLRRCAAIAGLWLASTAGQEQPKQASPAAAAPLEVLWEQRVEIPGAIMLAIDESRVFLTSAMAGLTAYSHEDGKVLWPSAVASALAPVALDSLVAVVSDGVLHVLRAGTGAPTWQADAGLHASVLFSFPGHLAIASDREVRTWRTAGTPDWSATLTGRPTTAFVFSNGALFVGLDEPSLVALDAATGALRWKIRLRAQAESLAATDDRLYLGAADGWLYSYRTTGDPDPSWRTRRPRSIGQPVAGDRHVYFALLDNSVRAFDRDGGSERWSSVLRGRPMPPGPILFGKSLIVALGSGQVVEVSAADGRANEPPKPTTLTTLRLQQAAAAPDGTRVFTVTTGTDNSRTLAAWGRPPAKR